MRSLLEVTQAREVTLAGGKEEVATSNVHHILLSDSKTSPGVILKQVAC